MTVYKGVWVKFMTQRLRIEKGRIDFLLSGRVRIEKSFERQQEFCVLEVWLNFIKIFLTCFVS